MSRSSPRALLRVVAGATAVVALSGVAKTATAEAHAGTAGQTVSLGKSNGLEYMRAKLANVVSQAGAPANCDGDAEVTGGGGSIAGPGADVTLNATFPLTGPASGWQAEGTTTQGAAQTVTSFAVCGGLDVSVVTTQSPLGTNTVLHALRTCAGDTQPLGGGGRATGAGILLVGSRAVLPPSTTGWGPIAYNRTQSDTLFDSHAVCGEGYTVRYRESERIKLPVGDAVKAVAQCKPAEAVLGGGFFAEKQGSVGHRASALATKPWDSKADAKKVPDDGWLARAQNLETYRVNLVAQAVCRRPA